ncbi:hypothetical protein MIH18_10760 [Marinobacter sp. M3C]|jgi:hypothetical protein|uniref:hypothetical protein n=1 Tax=unclassified Marinobacter TaxID=83889 RepID=UPI00200D2820|nr:MULTISPECIES: hypothetical protein [unclassified Marinobacter]MCL1477189.1 hypothetical protein [Marinobacter sp.]MCL1484891.1 hypothetical protein [Marinobacter sp.]UQG56451.1 hypothetical protein MIH16_01870 [Marinobacter sp. M4C]UQG62352.1 hypothetical protein MIH18_10760 [Marinobacter sp. M3C]UQG65255.1 hypothetical protein MIH17_01870 [Marinobacter sp. M2C]
MENLISNSSFTRPVALIWPAKLRLTHWLIALSLLGGVSLTQHGEYGHSELGWMALGLLFATQLRSNQATLSSLALWFITAVLVAINLSGSIAPNQTMHISVTLIGVLLGAFYFATVVLETINWLSVSQSKKDPGKPLTV